MSFNKGKCRVLHLGRNNSMHRCRFYADLLGRNSAEKDLDVLIDNRLATSPCGILGYIKKSVASMSMEMILLFYSALWRLHLESYVQ